MRSTLLRINLSILSLTIAGSVFASDGAQTVLHNFKQHGFQFGWSAGKANNDNGKDVRFFKVTDVKVSGTHIDMRYDWEAGRLDGHLHKAGSHEYEGKWIQNNGKGGFHLLWDQDFQRATGWWWNEGDKKHRHRAYIQ